jgi:hypothetical protein
MSKEALKDLRESNGIVLNFPDGDFTDEEKLEAQVIVIAKSLNELTHAQFHMLGKELKDTAIIKMQVSCACELDRRYN